MISIVANLCNLKFFANIFAHTVLTDLLTQFCWKLIYMHVIRWCMSEIIDLKKIVLVIANLCKMQVICKYVCEYVLTDLLDT